MNRRRFLASAAGAGGIAVAGPWVSGASAASDDELAYANFGVSAELLLADYYARAIDAKVLPAASAGALRRGRTAANRHAKALGDLLVGAGQAAPAAEDFAFEWPDRAFATATATVATGLGVIRPVLGAYQSATAAVSEPGFRVLYASLVASLGQQATALAGPAALEPFPAAVDLEAASAALEASLG